MPAPAGFLTALFNIKPTNQTEITQLSLTYKPIHTDQTRLPNQLKLFGYINKQELNVCVIANSLFIHL